MTPVEIVEGAGTVILGQPHGGTCVPDGIASRLNETGRGLSDTDWHIAQLHDGLLPDATVVRATAHRYVIDVNRDPSGASLYPGQNTTGLCPVTDFDGRPIWKDGQAPSSDEIETRRETFHAPYHAALADQIARVRARHGIAVLYDCHSIRGTVPYLFDGDLPDFNIGTDGGATCAPSIEAAVLGACKEANGYTHVLNGRFKGGWTTRHYGHPEKGVHAIQMELAQRTYMDEAAPWTWRDDKASQLRPVLAQILQSVTETITQAGLRAS